MYISGRLLCQGKEKLEKTIRKKKKMPLISPIKYIGNRKVTCEEAD